MTAIAFALLIPITVLFLECLAVLLPKRKVASLLPRTKIDVLIPAHNEARGIGATLSALLPQMTAQDRVIVVADNCEDQTAAIARTFGALVLERQQLELSGKGYALDYGLRFIAAEPPEVVVMIDADCIAHPGMIENIARQAMATKRPVQATYLMQIPDDPTPKDTVSGLAFMVKNLVRPLGLERMGLPCLLTGTGMAFPWSVIHTVSLASSNIVEDMQLAVDLAIAGYPAMFCADAQTTGVLPQQERAARSQRTRWEHGHLQTLLKQVPRLLKASIAQKRYDLLAIALELSIPPLSLLVSIWAGITVISVFAGVLGASWLPTIILAIEGFLILISIFTAWLKFGRTSLPATTLLAVPSYILWKIPLYFNFLVQPQRKWIRTERDPVNVND